MSVIQPNRVIEGHERGVFTMLNSYLEVKKKVENKGRWKVEK